MLLVEISSVKSFIKEIEVSRGLPLDYFHLIESR
jgi:hypothetical protein